MAWLCCGPTRGALLSTSSAEARPHRLRDRSAAKASKHLDQHVRFPWRASHAREVSADPQSTRHAERTYRCCGVAQRAARSSPRRRPSLDPTESTTDRRQGIRNVVLTAFEYRGARPARILPRVSSTDRPRNTRLRVCHANGGCALEATACTSHHGLAPRERDLPPDAVLFHSACTDHSQRSTARARGKLACFATSRETASAVARSRVPRESRL